MIRTNRPQDGLPSWLLLDSFTHDDHGLPSRDEGSPPTYLESIGHASPREADSTWHTNAQPATERAIPAAQQTNCVTRNPRRLLLAGALILGIVVIIAAVVGHLAGRQHGKPKKPHQPAISAPPSPTYTGVATFNNYSTSTHTVCGPKLPGVSSQYGAAVGDLSPNISAGHCLGEIDATHSCNNATQKPVQGYVGPPCPATQCGKCFSIKNIGPYGGNFPENMIGGNVTVEIIDACPATNAFNYCKSTIPIAERCGDPNTNSIDIDETAYQALTGIIWDSRESNLRIEITPVDCNQ